MSRTRPLALMAIAASSIGLIALAPSALASQTKKSSKTQAKPAAVAAQPGAAATAAGKKVFAAQGCGNCHAVGGVGGTAGPDLTAVASNPIHTASWLTDHINKPTKHKPDSTMPAFAGKIKPADMTSLVGYLSTLKVAASSPNSTSTGGYKELGEIRAWAFTTKQAPSEDHVNLDLKLDKAKKPSGQVVIMVEQPMKMFYALNMVSLPKKELLSPLKPEARNEPPSTFKVVFKGGTAHVDVDGKFNPGDGKLKPAHLSMEVWGIGTVSQVGNPLGEMKVGFAITDPATKAVLWRSDLKKVTNGYVRVYAPD